MPLHRRLFTDSSPSNSYTDFRTSPTRNLDTSTSPTRMSTLTSYHGSSPTHQSWDSALNDILSVLRIQYRNDDDVMVFLTDPDKLKQLQYSTAAKMEWNRRVIKEEMDSGIHSPPRSRRIAKEVAIDYIRRYLDGEEERVDMMRKIQILQSDKDDALTSLVELEKDLKRSKDDNLRLTVDNNSLKDEIEKLRSDNELSRSDNKELRVESEKTREENEVVRSENATLRDENKKLRDENQELRAENATLRSENQKVRGDNVDLREEAGTVRSENLELRRENQSLREENQEVRSENLKVRGSNTSLRGENERFRGNNESLLNENRKLVRENLEFRGREDEMRMLVNVQQDLLTSGKEVKTSGDDPQEPDDGAENKEEEV